MASTSALAIASPMPVPSTVPASAPSRLKGSKALRTADASMPRPLSATCSPTRPSAASAADTVDVSRPVGCT
jgi:hypothetical protein